MATVSWPVGAELPDLGVWWLTDAGALVDFSVGWTFQVTGPFTKSTGITGAAGSGDGTGAADVPNITVAWTSVDLGSLAAGGYSATIVATRVADSKVRILPLDIRITS